MVYLLHMDQHLAQGTSLFILLPPIGLGSLAGILEAGPGGFCAAGILCAPGEMLLGRLRWEFNSPPHAIPELERIVRLLPGAGGIATVEEESAALQASADGRAEGAGPWLRPRDLSAALASWQSPACAGVASGNVRGRRWGPFWCLSSGCCLPSASIAPKETSLVALIPPTGVLALTVYSRGRIRFPGKTGVLLIPGNIFGRYRPGGNPGEEDRSAKHATDFLLGSWFFARRVAGVGAPGGARGGKSKWSIYIVTSCRVSMMDRPPWKKSMAMAESAMADGITHLVATPHSSNEYFFDFAPGCESFATSCKAAIGDPADHRHRLRLSSQSGESRIVAQGCNTLLHSTSAISCCSNSTSFRSRPSMDQDVAPNSACRCAGR